MTEDFRSRSKGIQWVSHKPYDAVKLPVQEISSKDLLFGA